MITKALIGALGDFARSTCLVALHYVLTLNVAWNDHKASLGYRDDSPVSNSRGKVVKYKEMGETRKMRSS